MPLKKYLVFMENISGHTINYGKSGNFFSSNVDENLRMSIGRILGVSNPLNTRRYLGLPSLIGKDKKAIFDYIRERV